MGDIFYYLSYNLVSGLKTRNSFRGRDRRVVGFTTTRAINAYYHH